MVTELADGVWWLDFGGVNAYLVDGNQCVFETGDGSTWEKLGIADANVNLYGGRPWQSRNRGRCRRDRPRTVTYQLK